MRRRTAGRRYESRTALSSLQHRADARTRLASPASRRRSLLAASLHRGARYGKGNKVHGYSVSQHFRVSPSCINIPQHIGPWRCVSCRTRLLSVALYSAGRQETRGCGKKPTQTHTRRPADVPSVKRTVQTGGAAVRCGAVPGRTSLPRVGTDRRRRGEGGDFKPAASSRRPSRGILNLNQVVVRRTHLEAPRNLLRRWLTKR